MTVPALAMPTLLPEITGDINFWTIDLFMAELDNLLKALSIEDNYDFLGNETLRYFQWSREREALFGEAARKLISELPQESRDMILKHKASKTYDDAEFEKAALVFHKRHVCRLDEWPEDLMQSLNLLILHNNPTVYFTMNGPSEFTMIGPLKDYSAVGRLHIVHIPMLIINREFDETTDSVDMPFFYGDPKGIMGNYYQFISYALARGS
ncbi:hypothetical protein TrVFT333_002473 [Trichoderma virens FT-333]|nr:hypothetical protein TrVFT333_002473 [Trichoderma virens FT-333]